MRVVASLLWRAVFFWGLLVALGLPLALCVMGDEEFGFFGGVAVLRAVAFVLIVSMLFWEWRSMRRAVLHLRAILADLGVSPPGQPELGVSRLAVVLPTLAGFVILLELRSIWATGELATQPFILAFVWTVATVHVVSLLLGSVTLWRTRRAVVRALGRRPTHPADAWPGTVALSSAAILALVFVRLPGLWIPAGIGGVFVGSLQGLAASLEQMENAPPVELLVELGPDDHIGEIAELVAATEGRVIEQAAPNAKDPDLRQTWVVEVPADVAWLSLILFRLDDENVDSVELNAVATSVPAELAGACGPALGLGVNDPFGQPAWERVGGAAALVHLSNLQFARPVTIAVIDTGVARHEDLQGVLVDLASDRRGHGTAVASAAAASTHNGRGIASLNLAGRFLRVRSYPALAHGGGADEVAEAIVNAAADGAKVIVMSFSGKGSAPSAVRRAVAEARSQGVILVAAAGNVPDADAWGAWPANISGVVRVGATENGERAAYSSTTWWASSALSAPGSVCAATLDGGYREVRGTSMSAPLVAGLLGTVWSVCPQLSADDVVGVVRRTAASGPWGLGPEIRADLAVLAAGAACR